MQMDNIKSTDYSKQYHWLSLPTSGKKPVDVFFLYPTAVQTFDKDEKHVCKIDNASMVAGANISLKVQASAFETVGNIYAPYYRQANITVLSLPPKERDSIMEGIPKSDILAAFDYYIQNYNQGRPFLLASHSQGSTLMLYLLSEYMKEHPNVYHRMIAAYVIGYSVTSETLAQNLHLKFAEGPDDTGVIISYNTEAPGINEQNPVLSPGSITINPISWTREEILATAQENLGSLLISKEGEVLSTVKNYADACVNKARGALICSTVDANTLPSGIFPKGVFHSFDYSLYFYNIRDNADNRTKKFLNNWKNNVLTANPI